jgi:predicted metal-dependent phosphoesterase TrpH
MIDLHRHTTASDGRSRPSDLVDEAANAGLTTIAVTDHDTLAGLPEAEAAARQRGIACLPGIEITAVHAGRDVHILAYFVSPASDELGGFLERQRADRRRRLFEMAERLERAGVPVDQEGLRRRATGAGRSAGRPMLADALVRAGHVSSISEAFERYLGQGRPGFVAREGATPSEVIALVSRAGGLTSLAHPGKLRSDDLIPGMVEAGLPAIEVNHPDHDEIDVRRYRQMATTFGLLVTGGSDYHGPGSGRTAGLGHVTLAQADFERLAERGGWTGAS